VKDIKTKGGFYAKDFINYGAINDSAFFMVCLPFIKQNFTRGGNDL